MTELKPEGNPWGIFFYLGYSTASYSEIQWGRSCPSGVGRSGLYQKHILVIIGKLTVTVFSSSKQCSECSRDFTLTSSKTQQQFNLAFALP